MAEETTNNNQPAQPPTAPPNNSGGDSTTPGPVPYERFKEVNDQVKTLTAQIAKFEAEQKKAAEKLATEQGKWQELAQQRENELKAEKLARLRLEVASRKGIPVDLVDRLKGETAEEMEADAAALLAFLKPKEGPGVPPPKKATTPQKLDLSMMTPEEIRKAAKGKRLSDFT